MSDPPASDSGVTREEFAALMTRLDALASAQDELREASTQRERDEASAAVEDKEDAFARAAKQSGLTREQIASAVAKAKDEEDYGRFSKHMERFIAESPDDDPPPKGEKDDPPPKGEKDDPPPKGEQPAPKPPKPPKDTEPEHPHWSERAVGELLK